MTEAPKNLFIGHRALCRLASHWSEWQDEQKASCIHGSWIHTHEELA